MTVPYTSHICPAPCEVALESAETSAALQWIREHPGDMPILMVYHLQNFLTPYTDEADMPLDRFPDQNSSRFVLKMSETMPYAVFALAEILIFYGNARFRSPIEPLLLLLGAGTLWWLTEPQPGTLRTWLRGRATRC